MKPITINLTVEIPDYFVTDFENWLNRDFNLISYKVVSDTKQLYENNATFRKLVKKVKEAQQERDKFINENN